MISKQIKTRKIVKNAINNIKKNTNIPVAVGFGIKGPKDAAAIANTGCDGIVVGSALVEIIGNSLRKKKSNQIGRASCRERV